ncbi:MAG: PHP domain-containing protein [archaeon]|jgi:histidinol phosphatase-like PHP family hydrolase
MTSLPNIDLHVHSDFSCCPATMQEVTWEAKLAGIKTLGFSDHYDKILDNSTFEKYYKALLKIEKTDYLNIKKGVEVELKDFDKLIKDLEKEGNGLDHIFYHNLRDFNDLCAIQELAKKTSLKIIIAHPEVGYWETPNDKIIDFIKQNKLTIEINKTHISMLKDKTLEKEKDFFKKILNEPALQVSFGSDYHSYGAFSERSELFEQLWSMIDKKRVYLYETTLMPVTINLPDINEWANRLNIKNSAKVPLTNTNVIKENLIISKVSLLKEVKMNPSTKLSNQITNLISENNNTGLNMFYFELLSEICAKDKSQGEALLNNVFDKFSHSKIKDIRRYTHQLVYEIAEKNPNLKDKALERFVLAALDEKSNALKKKLEKYAEKLKPGA